jgi:hypothetical protein
MNPAPGSARGKWPKGERYLLLTALMQLGIISRFTDAVLNGSGMPMRP